MCKKNNFLVLWAYDCKTDGESVFTGERYVVLDVGGVGYKVYLSMETLRLVAKNKGETSVPKPKNKAYNNASSQCLDTSPT